MQGLNTERRLRATSEALFPAALQGQIAESSFERAVKEFSDAVLVQDVESLDEAATQGRRAADNLRAVSATRGLPRALTTDAAGLAASIVQYLADARTTYGPVASSRGIIPVETQRRMQNLALRNTVFKASLERLKDQLSNELRLQLAMLQQRSVRLRWLGLIVFGVTLAIAAVLVNLTIRRAITRPLLRVEAELAHERDLLRVLLDHIPDCIYFKDTHSRFIRINKAQSLLLGIRKEADAIGRTNFDFLQPDFAQEAYDDEREIVRSGQARISKMERLQLPDGARWMTSTKVPVKDESGEVHLIVGISRDFTAWKEAVDALQKSEESFRLLFAAIPHPVWVCDAGTLRFIEVNEAAVRHYGYSAGEFRQLPMSALYPPEDTANLQKALASAGATGPPGGSWRQRTKDGRVLDVEIFAREFEFHGRRALLVIAQDVTGRKRLELELQQAQRLESVGQLAAGIAHEMNTPIQWVRDNLLFLQDAFVSRQAILEQYEGLRRAAEENNSLAPPLAGLRQALESADADYLAEETPRAIAQSLDGVQRVSSIVRAMKEFAHPGYREKAAADLNKAIENALIVAKNEYKFVADVETDFGELPAVDCRIAEMNQVFLNLIVNAAHAIGEVMKETGQKGKIGIRTRLVGDQAVIAISDTGCGISAAIQAKVFDPFFTTKPVGKGTGQGLAISRSIVVDKHGGSLRFEPNETQGTTFLISVPVKPARVSEDYAGRPAELVPEAVD